MMVDHLWETWLPGQIGNSKMKIELQKTFQFEAAHSLPRLPQDHKCYRLHGHSFKATLHVSGECDEDLGWLIDYAEISDAFKPLWEQLDHHHLNEIEGLENPTSENIARWIWTTSNRPYPYFKPWRLRRPATPVAFTEGTRYHSACPLATPTST